MSKKKKILIYNWVQFDKNDGGGVTVYINNIINKLKDKKNLEIYFISSGYNYDIFRKKIRIKETKNIYGDKVRSFSIYNSPVMFAYNQFSRIDIYNNDKSLGKVFDEFIKMYGDFDVIHFNNLEGLSPSVLKLKEKYPKTKFIYSMHNYFPVCPNVYLWKHNCENCKDFQNGKGCCNCIDSNYSFSKNKLRIRNLLEKFNIDLKRVQKFYNKILKLKSIKTNENDKCETNYCLAKEYKRFREINVDYLNKYVDFILCVSKRVKEIAVNHNINEKKCYVSYIGTKFANNLQRQDIDINSNKFNLIYLGYMSNMKGFDFLIESLLGLDKKIAKNINLYLVCRNNIEYDINSITNKLKKIFNSVNYIDGYTHEQLPNILKDKHLGVVPVVWEDNLPQVSIEIISFGVPILASDLGGASELCNDRDFKFKGSDLKDFRKKLTNIVNNRQKLDDFWENYNKPTTMEEHMKELYEYYEIKELK